MSDVVSDAAIRLEQAVEKLAAVLARRAMTPAVPPEAVAELSARLDETLLRLRGALAEMESSDSPALPEEDAMAEDTAPAGGAAPNNDTRKGS